MRYATRLIIALCAPLLLLALTSDHISESIRGETTIGAGKTSTRVNLLLQVDNVREQVVITARCRGGSPLGRDLEVEIGGLNNWGASKEGIADLRLPAGQSARVPFTVECHRSAGLSDVPVYWEVDARARPPGGCTPSAIFGHTPTVALSMDPTVVD